MLSQGHTQQADWQRHEGPLSTPSGCLAAIVPLISTLLGSSAPDRWMGCLDSAPAGGIKTDLRQRTATVGSDIARDPNGL
jgi:hypothetical protein